MTTTSGSISARTSLLSRAPARTGGSFALTLATTERALDVTVPVQPPDSTLVLTGATTHAPVDARLPAVFEGASVTVLDAPGGGVAQAVVDTTARNPAGCERARGRSRGTRRRRGTSRARSQVSWGGLRAWVRGSV